MMNFLGRLRRHHNSCSIFVLACGTLVWAGCGASDSAAPVETAQADAPPAGHGAADGAHAVPSAPGHGDHGATPTNDAHGGHGAPSAPGGHGAAPGAHETPPAHGAHGSPSAHGGGATPMPSTVPGAHAGPGAVAHSAHGAPPANAHAAPMAHGAQPRPFAAHGAPAGGPIGENAAAPANGTAKPTTGQWLAGMAAAVMTDGGGAQAGPGNPGAMQPGFPGAAHGAPGGFSGQPSGINAAGAHGGPAAGEMPAAPGQGFQGQALPGQDLQGQGVPGAAQQPTQEFEKGTADYAVQQLVLKMQAGETEGMSELISEKTKDGVLAPLRDGTASDEQIAAAQELVASPQMLGKRESGITMMYYVRNAAGQSLTFGARRGEDGDYRVTSLRVETPQRRRGR